MSLPGLHCPLLGKMYKAYIKSKCSAGSGPDQSRFCCTVLGFWFILKGNSTLNIIQYGPVWRNGSFTCWLKCPVDCFFRMTPVLTIQMFPFYLNGKQQLKYWLSPIHTHIHTLFTHSYTDDTSGPLRVSDEPAIVLASDFWLYIYIIYKLFHWLVYSSCIWSLTFQKGIFE